MSSAAASVINVKETGLELLLTMAFVAAVVASGGQPIVVGATLALVIFVGTLLGSKANHVNPAITLGLLAAGKLDIIRAAALVSAQLVGGALGVLGTFSLL